MLETKCVDDNLKMLVTVLAISVTNILYFITLASGTNIQKMSPNINFVANILKLSPTVSHQHQNVTNMTVAAILWACLFLKNFLLVHFCRSVEKISIKSGTCPFDGHTKNMRLMQLFSKVQWFDLGNIFFFEFLSKIPGFFQTCTM